MLRYRYIFDELLERSFTAIKSRLFMATAVVSAMTALVMVATIGRDLTIAYRYGTGDPVDAFVMALLLPTLTVQIVAVALATTSVPEYIRLAREDAAAAEELAREVATWGLMMLAGVAVLLSAAASHIVPLLTSSFSLEKSRLTQEFYFWLMPTIPIQGWSTLIGCLINARQRFGLVAAAPALRPLFLVMFLWFGPKDQPMLLVWSLLVGSIVEAGVIGGMALRIGVPIQLRWRPLGASARSIFLGFGPMSAGSIIISSATFADQYLAGRMAPGSLAAFSYGGKIVSLVVSLCALPLSVTMLPHFADLASGREWERFNRAIVRASIWLALVAGSLSLLCTVYSKPLVGILLHRGAFSLSDTELVAQVQSLLVLQLPFYVLGIFWVRALAALQHNWSTAAVAVANAGANLSVSITLMRGYGVLAVAIGVTAGYISASLVAGYLSVRALKLRRLKEQPLVSGGRD